MRTAKQVVTFVLFRLLEFGIIFIGLITVAAPLTLLFSALVTKIFPFPSEDWFEPVLRSAILLDSLITLYLGGKALIEHEFNMFMGKKSDSKKQ